MKNKIMLLVNHALDILYNADSYLIQHAVEDEKLTKDMYNYVAERSIVFRFGLYFVNEAKFILSDYDVDVEYNRNENVVKREKNDKAIIPDLIIHKRGNNDNNLAIIEFKPWWNLNYTRDKEKIETLCSSSGKYKYKYGLWLGIGKKREDVIIKIYTNGEWRENNE